MKNKNLILKMFFMLVAILSLIPLFSCNSGNNDEDSFKNDVEYQYVIRMCNILKNKMKNPDSFSVSGTCKYSTNEQQTKFVVIPFRGQNGFGGYTTDTAYFSKDTFRGTYNEYKSSNCSYDIVTKIIISDMIESTNWDKYYTAEQVNHGL